MSRIRKILFGLSALVLLSWVGSAVENSSAHPLGHAHKHILSLESGQKHSYEDAVAGKFFCQTDKYRSLASCLYNHSQKEMVLPKQNATGLDCGGSTVKSVPGNTGSDYNSVLMVDMSLPDLPAMPMTFLPIAGCL